ncbi:hypothetical protein AB4K20DRAFT_1888266 [Rhizopus microsporus]
MAKGSCTDEKSIYYRIMLAVSIATIFPQYYYFKQHTFLFLFFSFSRHLLMTIHPITFYMCH